MIRASLTFTCDVPGCIEAPVTIVQQVQPGQRIEVTLPPAWRALGVQSGDVNMPFSIYGPKHSVSIA